jgi:hypothetical protein
MDSGLEANKTKLMFANKTYTIPPFARQTLRWFDSRLGKRAASLVCEANSTMLMSDEKNRRFVSLRRDTQAVNEG